jgi:phosphopantetheine adenylyltransferase
MKGAKHLQLRMLRAAEPEDFIEALVEGIEENSSATELANLKERIAQLEKTIKIIGAARVDDTINFDFVPNVGTTLAVNGVRKGSAIEGADFYDAVLKIFIGSFPVEGPLKAGLLGKFR